jgi:hypothetical protein
MSDETKKGKYKVCYYMVGNTVAFKWFNTFEEATQFCVYKVKTGDVIEVKWYKDES